MKFIGVTPNLITNDLERSRAFYCDVLGFAVTTSVPPDSEPKVFVMLQRDDVQVFLNDAKTALHDVPDAASSFVPGQSGVAMFVVVEDIATYWDQVRDRVRVVMPLKDQWYGMTEFSVTDPDGYLITFAERKTP